jgi:hypothetical protein
MKLPATLDAFQWASSKRAPITSASSDEPSTINVFAALKQGDSLRGTQAVTRDSRVGVRSGLSSPGRLEQEPCATFRLVDPVLDQARRGDIAMLVADIVGLPHALSERQVASFSSVSMSSGVTKSASLSLICFTLAMWPIERIVVPPILRALSAISSVIANICAAYTHLVAPSGLMQSCCRRPAPELPRSASDPRPTWPWHGARALG